MDGLGDDSMRLDKKCEHSTENELDFIDRIGRHCEHRSEVRRLNALDGYITAARKRTDWGEIDSHRVIAHALRLIG